MLLPPEPQICRCLFALDERGGEISGSGAGSAHQTFGTRLGAEPPFNAHHGHPLTPGMTPDTVGVFHHLGGILRESDRN